MKKISLFLTLALVLSLLAGCAGTPVVYYTDCTCPPAAHTDTQQTTVEDSFVPAEGALKTGLAIVTGIGESKSATAEALGEAKYDVTMVAVLVDEKGVIQDCIIDGIAASVMFNSEGALTDKEGAVITELAAPQTKNELGEKYGMVAYGNAIAEWDAQAAALAAFAIGKDTVDLRSGAIDETGYAPEGTDLATSATIYLGGYVGAIEQAVANAKHLGAEAGDTLKLAAVTGLNDSTPAAGETAGNAQLDVTATALTLKGDTISSCYIDSVQAKVGFDATGTIPAELPAPQTKNQLGEKYGMVAYGNAIAEWDAQAAAFASYITGMTAEAVSGISVTEKTSPAPDTDLVASCTIAIGGFQALIAKACK